MLRPPFHNSSSAPLFTAAEETQDPPIVQTQPGLEYDLHVSRTRQLVPSPGRIILSCRRSFVHVENRGGAALRLGDAVRGVAFRTFGPARHRPLSNHLSTRYDNKSGACACVRERGRERERVWVRVRVHDGAWRVVDGRCAREHRT